MNKYAKFINEDLIEYPPRNKGNVINYNLNESRLKEDGFLLLKMTVKPKGNYICKYSVVNNEIVQSWVEVIEEPLSYMDKRRPEYKSFGEQLDMIYHDRINGTNLWEEHITAVKNKYPKKDENING